MQLKKRRRLSTKGQVQSALAAMTAALFVASTAQAQINGSSDDDTNSGSHVDAAFLFYQESDHRVRAVEPSVNATLNLGEDHLLTLGFVSDSLTGASPNGAAPATQPQTFVTPIRLKGSTTTGTSASGRSIIVQIPPTPGQVAAAAYGRQYTVAPNALPVDPGFHDQRFGGTVGWAQPISNFTKIAFGASYSGETDYRAITANASLSQDFNSRNTTANVALNVELDSSQPYGGTPTPLTQMSAQWKRPNADRTVFDAVLGITQIMTRYWIAQLNYSYGRSQGYNSDPYRIVSVVDGISGEPLQYLYESRPDTRSRESLFLDNKIHLDSRNVADLSFRYFWDTWSIHSTTLEVNDRFALNDYIYTQPLVRWYRQTAAWFYQPYIVNTQNLPAYISSDSRLAKFSGMTYSLKMGFKVGQSTEVSIQGQYYTQAGNGHPANAIGQLAQQDLFVGVKAVSFILGYSMGF